MMTERFGFEIVEHIAVLHDSGAGHTLELNRISFNGYPPKLDLRKWHNCQPMKGVTLTDQEARKLLEALQRTLE